MKFTNTLLIPFLLGTGAFARTFTVTNKCAYTVWPGMYTDLTAGTAVPDHPTGWEAVSGSSVSFEVPDNWQSGRIWGRRDCDFSTNPGPNSCVTGGCNGGLLCSPTTGTGVPPASVAEWTLKGEGNVDYYDVSLVDGFNIPMEIINNKGCSVPSCHVDLNYNCPSNIQGPRDAAGVVKGCKSSCLANLDGNPADSANCCSGDYDTFATCPAAKVQFYDFFKSACPDSYAYAYDEFSHTALFSCDSALAADYTLIFCP